MVLELLNAGVALYIKPFAATKPCGESTNHKGMQYAKDWLPCFVQNANLINSLTLDKFDGNLISIIFKQV